MQCGFKNKKYVPNPKHDKAGQNNQRFEITKLENQISKPLPVAEKY
ncbi:Uncharacterized protein dnl_50580 [Desulfonema limicola]|uniref:Uncharacterized protein n=1 Tax=Desulfonema limicola TaxID=45656 RepID=A0A975GIL3_9BACT|nr:Uncharacterized protein dnl_50580 [Desulfonema limicola]